MFHLPISTLRYYDKEGSSTFPARRQLFENRKKAVEAEIERLQKTLDLLKYKCWYYDQAIADGSLDKVNAMLPDGLPEEIQKFYDNGHSRQ